MENFRLPYFSRDIAEFWRRWHVSLTTWFRDYLYIPLGGSRCGMAKKIRNTFVIFLVSGLWHGANWTFVLWGLFHAICFIPLLLLGVNRRRVAANGTSDNYTVFDVFRISMTFALVSFGWMIFRAPDVSSLFCWIGNLFDFNMVGGFFAGLPRKIGLKDTMMICAVFFSWEWLSRKYRTPLLMLPKFKMLRWIVYLALLIVLFVYMPDTTEEFIYFQF